MKTAVKSPESAVHRRGLGIFLTETPPTDTRRHLFRPLFPRNPHFPALRSVPMALSGDSRRNNPHFPALRSVPMALSGDSRRKQIPSSYHVANQRVTVVSTGPSHQRAYPIDSRC